MSNFVNFLLKNKQETDKEFILGSKEFLSYGELYDKVNSLAAYIYEKYGSGKEFLLLSDNSIFFIISYLSIIKSGNIAVLVESRASKKDLNNIISLCDFEGYFVQNRYNHKFNEDLISEEILESSRYINEDFFIKRKDDDTAIIIFTSGSTGAKKGVVLSHKNLITNTESIISYMNLKATDIINVVLPFSYSYGASLLHSHLRVGGSIVISNTIFLGAVINEIKKYCCTGFAGVPSTYQILINKTDFLNHHFPSLRYLTQAGGLLPNKYIKMLSESFKNSKFYVMYGATEATARLSYLPPELIKTKLGSLGKGIPGVKLDVLNENGDPVKPGEIGEITAMGDNIMKEYYKDACETCKVLKDGKLYTGDLATVDSDGYIFIKGRSKNIIKSAGYRVSPTEVENLINSIENVSGCVVIGMPHDIMGEAVTAVIQPIKCNLEDLKKEIERLCNRSLPAYKIPQRIVFIKEFPLTSSYKIDTYKIREDLMNDNLLSLEECSYDP